MIVHNIIMQTVFQKEERNRLVYVVVYRSADAHYISVISFIFYNEKLCCVHEQICSVIFRSKEGGIKFPHLIKGSNSQY
jgi:hypothetical protein